MRTRHRLLSAFAAGALAVLPLAPAPAHAEAHAARTSWTREDPSFLFRWDPCQPIPYRVNLAGTPKRNLVVLRSALAEISTVTGFTFVYAGRTKEVPYAKGRGRLHQVPDGGLTIAWTTPHTVPALRGKVVGLGGPGASYQRIGKEWKVDSGGVVIDRTARITARMVNGPSLMSVLLHELGHAMGLGHSRSKADVMYEGLGRWSRPHLGPGDRAGLRELSTSPTPCP